MLEEVLNYLHNFFVVGIYQDDYVIEDGGIVLSFVQDGQYFRIIGSVFNDGVYKYGDDLKLTDEAFTGSIWALAVPKAILSLVDEIVAWQASYGEITASPYTSESFGGYSYSKAANGSTENAMTWQTVFGSRLAPYRKLAELAGADYSEHQDPYFKRPFVPGRPT